MTSLDTIMQWSEMPDGMPHGKALYPGRVDYIDASIRSPLDLMRLGIAHDVLPVDTLRLHYVMGGRMDRPIDDTQPNTLRVAANFIRSLNIPHVACVWPHSPSTIDRLDAHHDTNGERRFLDRSLHRIRKMIPGDLCVVLPDAGAEKRYWNDHYSVHSGEVISCTKHRDMATGKLKDFTVNASVVPENCVIVDDLCDGGRTFTGIASKLRDLGAVKVGLIVYHGIFSAGVNLPGIDAIITSNSYRSFDNTNTFHCLDAFA